MRNIKKPKVGVHVRLGNYLHTNLNGVFHKINYQDVVRRRPGLGVKVYNLKKIIGKKLNKKVRRGTPVKFSNFV